MKQPTISIILPTYRVEKYIKQCLNSIVIQDGFPAFEVIIVHDGMRSADRTAQIAAEYAQKYPNIHLVRKAHAGVSAARNAGLAMATGKYISFVDPDDKVGGIMGMYERVLPARPDESAANLVVRHGVFDFSTSSPELNLDSKYFQRMLDLAERTNADVALAGKITYRKIPDPGMTDRWNVRSTMYTTNRPFDTSANSKEILMQQAQMRESANFALYRRDFLQKHNLHFVTDMNLDEDVLFCQQCVLYANRVVTVADSAYLYNNHPNSLSYIVDEAESARKYHQAHLQHFSILADDLSRFPELGHVYKRWLSKLARIQNAPRLAKCADCTAEDGCATCSKHADAFQQIQDNIKTLTPNYRPKAR